MKKNGFVSTSLIYTFFIVFLLLMIFLLNSYSSTRFLLERYKYDIKNSFAEKSVADINLYFMVWNSVTQDYEVEDEMPVFGYHYESSYSYCKNGSDISYTNGNIVVTAIRRDSCYAYFNALENDIILRVYTKETNSSERVLVKNVPSYNYKLTSSNCTNGASLTFDERTRKFKITASKKTECEVEFTKKDMDIILNIYKEDAYGNHEWNNLKYKGVTEIPGLNYTFSEYTCLDKNVKTEILWDDNTKEILIDSAGKNECNVYFNGGTSKVELIIMQESTEGVSGHTSGLKYSRTFSIPGVGYKYVGYKCDNSHALVTYTNGTFETTFNGTEGQATCYAYFNKNSGNVFVDYYLETSNGYESVNYVPSLGYVYNPSLSSCTNGAQLKVTNNIVEVDTSSEATCKVYFDMAVSDIKVQVFVMDKQTGKSSLGNIPVSGYELYNAGCTNGASIEYKNGELKVQSEGPTVCTVYFR